MKCLHPRYVTVRRKDQFLVERVLVPCGKCAMCMEKRRNEWFVRISEEERYYHGNAWFITLTYDELFYPEYGASKSDLQKFFKRLRKAIEPYSFRYFFISEYGPNGLRAHYHGLIFGFPQNDYDIRTLCAKCWKFGFVTIDHCLPQRINYLASYMCDNKFVPHGMNKNFMLCSRRPAIGSKFLEDENSVHYYRTTLRTLMSIDGRQFPMPRYYKERIFDDDMKEQISEKSKDSYLHECRQRALTKAQELASGVHQKEQWDFADDYQRQFDLKRKSIRKKNNGGL